jgi:DNA processing protein
VAVNPATSDGFLVALYCLGRFTRASGTVLRDVFSRLDRPIRSREDLEGFFRENAINIPLPKENDWKRGEDVIAEHKNAGVYAISLFDPQYPAFLAAIFDPPPILYLRGDPTVLSSLPGVAVVGTRKASLHGLEIARRIAAYLGGHRWTIVSGLALGIDAAAHQGALDASTKTIAVLAHGLHRANPKRNEALAYEILERGGAWVSEHPLRVPPQPEYFVQRNRIQIGLSIGSIIVEADIRSGSTSQAAFCVQEKRQLFAVVPESDENPLGLVAAGTNLLVRQKGATAIRSKADYPNVLATLAAARDLLLGQLNQRDASRSRLLAK